eukprot:Phypoly_transcript_03493.p1 GENE.Phypoly_transcript_03493~~Phypoly_transcript_03493.p1  ORF type:complete len:737 (+),score=102.33 Phypoly_transcript_03493:194-2212(+)
MNTHGFGQEVQQKAVASEQAKFTASKNKLFQLDSNSCVSVVRVEVANKMHTIKLSNKIVLIQSVVRQWLARRRFKELQKNERQRNKVAFEILETEKTYVKNLDTLVKVFLTPLRELSRGPDPLVTSEDLTKIFSNCEMIAQIHKQLLESLEERMTKWSKTQLIGDIFVKWAPFLKLYTQYVSNYNVSLSTLAECKKRDPGLEDFFTDCANNPATAGKFFGDYQILPVQRIPRYEMLIKEIFKYTHQGHPDYLNLENALFKIQAVATKINETKRVTENLGKLLSIQTLFSGKLDDLVQPFRNFLREGIVYYDNPKKNQRTASRKSGMTTVSAAAASGGQTLIHPLDECYAFLMSDIIILSHKKVNLLDEKTFRYSLVCTISLLYATVEPLNNSSDLKVGFAVLSNQQVYSLYFESLKARDDWMETIIKSAAELERNTSTLKKEEEPELPPSPVTMSKESRLSMLMHIASDFATNQHPVPSSPSHPINLNPPSTLPSSQPTTPTPLPHSPLHNSSPAVLPSPSPTSSPKLSPHNSNNHPKLSSGNSYVNLNASSPILSRPPATNSKIKQALALYEEVYQLEIAMFQVPIDLKTLFPQYYQQLPPNYQQLLWSRVFALKQKIEQIDGFRDNITKVLKSEKVSTQLEHVITEGKSPVGNLQNWVKGIFCFFFWKNV